MDSLLAFTLRNQMAGSSYGQCEDAWRRKEVTRGPDRGIHCYLKKEGGYMGR